MLTHVLFTEVNSIDSKTKSLALIAIVVLAAAAGTLLASNQLNVNADTNSTDTVTSDTTTAETNTAATTSQENNGSNCFHNGQAGFIGTQTHNGFRSGQIKVSDEFKENVTNIAEADSDVQELINQGYNVTSVTPILQSTVDGNGYVTTRASTAIVTYTKEDTNSAGRAQVIVNLDEASVTKIYIETKTLIEK